MEKKFTELKEPGRTTYVFQRNNYGITQIIINSIIPTVCYEIIVKSGKRTIFKSTGAIDRVEPIRDQLLHDIQEDMYEHD